MLSKGQKERYQKNILTERFGEEGQEKLLASKVLIIGVGGLGSPVSMYLCAAGVGTLGLIDCDTVDESNLQRQVIHSEKYIGKSKTDSAIETLNELNSEVQIITYNIRIDAENCASIIKDYDFIVDATDNFETKFLINDVCVKLGKPFSHAGVVGHRGQIMTYVPEKGPCFRCVFKNPPPMDRVETAKTSGIIGAVAGIVGSIQAMECIKYILGIQDLLVGKMLTVDAYTMEFRTIKLPSANMNCSACGNEKNTL